jgi:hypothetical protein
MYFEAAAKEERNRGSRKKIQGTPTEVEGSVTYDLIALVSLISPLDFNFLKNHRQLKTFTVCL